MGIKPFKIDDFVKTTETIYKDASVFTPRHIPDVFKYREKEWNDIGRRFANFLNKVNIQIYISGPPGTGKTHMVSKLVDGFNEKFKRERLPFNFVVTNCQKLTYPAVIGSLAKRYNPNLKVSKKKTQELFPYITEGVGKINTCFVFDEIDKMFPSYPYTNPCDCLFNDFSRPGENIGISNAVIGCVVIANKPNLDKEKDVKEHTKDTFQPDRIYFKDYNAEQIRDILWERCNHGLQPKAVDFDSVDLFAKEIIGTSHGLRTAFRVFSNVGAYVNERGRNKILNGDLSAVLNISEIQEISDVIRGMCDLEQIMLFVMKEVIKRNRGDRFPAHADALVQGYVSFVKKVNKLGKTDLEERTQRHVMETVLRKMESYGLFSTGIKGLGRGKSTLKYYYIEDRDFNKLDSTISDIIDERYGVKSDYISPSEVHNKWNKVLNLK